MSTLLSIIQNKLCCQQTQDTAEVVTWLKKLSNHSLVQRLHATSAQTSFTS